MGDSDGKGEELGEASEGLGDGRACDAVPELQAPISSRAANAAQRFTKSTISDRTLPRLRGSTGRRPGMGLPGLRPGMGLTCLVKVGRASMTRPITALKDQLVKRPWCPGLAPQAAVA